MTLRRRQDWMFIATMILAAALRFCWLGAHSLWFDEALSGCIARLDALNVLTNAAGSSHPPGYYFLLHLWRPLGSSEFMLRLPTVLCSLLAVALTWGLAHELFDGRTARLAALGMAVAPFQVYCAQDARGHALTIALSAGLMWCFYRGVRCVRWGAWLGYGLFTALGLYVHYYTALVVVGLHLALLLDRRQARMVSVPLLVADGLAALAFAPQLAQFLVETGEYLGGLTSWQPSPSLLSPLTTLYYLLFGHVMPLGCVWAGLFLTLAVVVLIGVELVRSGGWKQASVLRAWALMIVVVTPLLIILAVSLIIRSIYLERSFAVVTPALMVWLARGIVTAPQRSPTPYLGAALATLMAVGMVFYFVCPDPAKPPLREVVEVIAEEAKAGDIRLHLQDASYLPALYYAPEQAGALVDAGQRLWLSLEVYALFGGRVITADTLPTSGRVWLTTMPGYVDPAQTELLAQWDATRAPLEAWNWEGVQVRLYDLGGEP